MLTALGASPPHHPVLARYVVGNCLNQSIYDTMLDLNNLKREMDLAAAARGGGAGGRTTRPVRE